MSEETSQNGIRVVGIVVVIAGILCLSISLWQHMNYRQAEWVGKTPGADADPMVVLIGVICFIGGVIIVALARKSQP